MTHRARIGLAAAAAACPLVGMFLLAGCGSSGGSNNRGLPFGPATLDQVTYGRRLVLSGGCGDCHSQGKADPGDATWLAGAAPGGGPGNFEFGPLGTTHAPNLTPDAATGAIHGATDRQVFNTLRWGLDPGDSRTDKVINSKADFPTDPEYVGPPMPWQAIRHAPDADIWAMVAYLKHGLKAVSRTVPDSTGPADHWRAFYASEGPYPAPSYPTAQEQFTP